ncbi:MAG TPA: sulfurtransferase TusA family protein [bacterium]|nr:sulfurtransferase TusA family protein [bacterium]HPS29381.1 sulfurtransferase TusA family protein [bacterium]
MNYNLDITNDRCPLTFIKTAYQLSKMNDGDILELLISEGEPLTSVSKEVEEYGHKIISVVHVSGSTYKITIQKSSDEKLSEIS